MADNGGHTVGNIHVRALTRGDYLSSLTCQACHREYPVKNRTHAGFSDQGFLYCDKDSTVLIFHAYDSRFEETVRCCRCVPWELSENEQKLVEAALIPCPCGGRFLFRNPLMCPSCGNPLAKPMMESIYYYVLDRIIDGENERVWTERAEG